MIENANARTDVYSLEYERHHKIQATDRVLDPGAHVGYFTQLIAPRCRFVVALEPHPENFTSLKERCRNAAEAAGMKWLPQVEHVGVCWANKSAL